MANLAKADLADDLRLILYNSGSERGGMVNMINYCWDLFVTQAGATPTTVHQATARADLITTANAELPEQWKTGGVW